MRKNETFRIRLGARRGLLVSVLTIAIVCSTIFWHKPMWDFLLQYWADILEVIYKVSGILLVIGLWQAYQQYKKTIELAKTNAKREAVCLAAQQCDHYGRELVKRTGELHRSIQEKKCEFLTRVKVTITDDKVSSDTAGVRPEDERKIAEHFQDITLVLNGVEGFAIYFASNVADDNIGYIECGRSFVNYFEESFALYCIDNRIQNYYPATQSLYWRWKKRIDTERLVKQHQELSKQMFITSKKIDPAKLKPRDPFGA